MFAIAKEFRITVKKIPVSEKRSLNSDTKKAFGHLRPKALCSFPRCANSLREVSPPACSRGQGASFLEVTNWNLKPVNSPFFVN